MSNNLLRLAFVGDVSLPSIDAAQAGTSDVPGWPDIIKAVGKHDFFVGNLECCLVDDRCNDEARSRTMAVPAQAADFLRETSFTDLNLANNHILDCGPQAIEITRERLTALGIRTFGAGSNRREAEETVYAKHGLHKVAFLGACDDSAYYARDGRPGVAPLIRSRLGRRVRAAATEADLVVVTLHADLEFSQVPAAWRQRLSRWLVLQGAHLVIQHHPHVLQGIETYQGGLIAYSLGNFIFKLRGNKYQGHRAGVHDSLVLVVDANLSAAPPQLNYRITPVRIADDHLPRYLPGPSGKKAIHQSEALSSLLADRRKHRRVWFQRCRAEAARRLFRIYYAIRRGNLRHGGRELCWLLARPEDRRWIFGLITLGYR